MKFLYNFGMSQDDAETERKALNIGKRNQLICIASAGEVPLNLLSRSNIQIDAVDISKSQLSLAKLKMLAAIHLEPLEAARFIGYCSGTSNERVYLYKKLSRFLEDPEKSFWDKHPVIFEKGPIHAARFEKYLSRFNWVGVNILGRKKLMRLFEFNDVGMQQRYFDLHLDTRRLKYIFKIAFHPKIYKKRGMDKQGLVHSGSRDIAEFFFSRFRNFCTATLARRNYLLQITFFNHILYMEALPEFLKEKGNQKIRNSIGNLSFHNESISDRIRRKPKGFYDSFALSNVGDWMSHEDYADLLKIIGTQSASEGKALLRYIHFAHQIPESLAGVIKPDPQFGAELESVDRYPFYSLLPMTILNRDN